MDNHETDDNLRFDELNLSDITDLDVLSLLILNDLMRNTESNMLRIQILENINKTLSIYPNFKKIPASSFYNKLDRLNKKGFIKYKRDDHGKIENIYTTTKVNLVMNEIKKMTNFPNKEVKNVIIELIPLFLKKIGMSENKIFDEVLLIDMEEHIDIINLNLIAEYAKSCSILANERYERYRLRGMSEDIKQTTISNSAFMVPDNYFDSIVTLGYDCNCGNLELASIDWLKECYRSLRQGGIFIASTFEEIESDHFLIQFFLNDLQKTGFAFHATKEEILEDFRRVGLLNPNTILHNGMVLVYAFKE